MTGARSMRPDAILDGIARKTVVRVEHGCEECEEPILPGTTAIKSKGGSWAGYAPQWSFFHVACYEKGYGPFTDKRTLIRQAWARKERNVPVVSMGAIRRH